jgi:Cu/Ag efflux protein CusF
MTLRIQIAPVTMAAALLFALTACHPQKPPQPKSGTYPVSGEILSVDKANQQVTMKHGDIPGLMPAMTMTYPLKDKAIATRLTAGDHVKAELVVQDGKADLENVVVQAR